MLLLPLLGLLHSGCATGKYHRNQVATAYVNQHTIFNPYWSDDAAHRIGRSNWPSARAKREIREIVHFHETVIHRQGRPQETGLDYYRRFTTHRTGTIRP